MDLWVVAAAAGAGYLGKYWQKFSKERQSVSFSGESELRNLMQQIEERNGPIRRLRLKQLGVDAVLDRESSEEGSGLATVVASTSEFDGAGSANVEKCQDCSVFPAMNEQMGDGVEGKGEFSDNSDDLKDVIRTQEARFNGNKGFRSQKPHWHSIKPLNSLESCLNAHLYRDSEIMEKYAFGSLPSPCIPTVRPLLVTDGCQVISRVSAGLGCGSREKGLQKGDGMHLEENETFLGLPPLPNIASMELPRKLKRNFERARIQRASHGAPNSQGSLNGMVIFFLGMTIGMMATLVANKREVDKLNELLRQTESLVQDLHEELEMKDLLTVKDLTNEGFESKKANEQSSLNGRPTALSPENEEVENSEMMSKIEAELEAELERLEQNMKASSSLKRMSDFVGLDPEFVAEVVQGELKVGSINEQPGEKSDSDCDSESSTHHSANYPVSPRDLSLRLHEVIQSRLEARIIELEAALENSQKRPHSMRQEYMVSPRELDGEVGSTSARESPIFVDDGDNHPLVINLAGETLDAYDKASEKISKMIRTDEAVPSETIYRNTFDKEWEERITRSWGSNEVGESEDEDDEMGRLLIKKLVEKTRQGSPAVLNAQRMLFSMNDH